MPVRPPDDARPPSGARSRNACPPRPPLVFVRRQEHGHTNVMVPWSDIRTALFEALPQGAHDVPSGVGPRALLGSGKCGPSANAPRPPAPRRLRGSRLVATPLRTDLLRAFMFVRLLVRVSQARCASARGWWASRLASRAAGLPRSRCRSAVQTLARQSHARRQCVRSAAPRSCGLAVWSRSTLVAARSTQDPALGEESSQTVTADLVVGADGYYSRIRRLVGRRMHGALPLSTSKPPTPETLTCFDTTVTRRPLKRFYRLALRAQLQS